MEHLRDKTGADSLTEVVRRAVTVYDVLVSAWQNGSTVTIRNKDGTEREIILV
jgi:hypothetical protein